MHDLNPHFHDLIKSLTSHGVEFIIVGAHALAFHGHSRATEDIDIWIKRSRANASKVRAALEEFGIGLTDESERDLTKDRKMIQFGIEPLRVDILTFLDGCDFDTAAPRSAREKLDGIEVRILGLEDWLATKRASGRRKDLSDIADLEEALGRKLT
jgi:predicted nucleotidyltransferase